MINVAKKCINKKIICLFKDKDRGFSIYSLAIDKE